MKYRLLFLTAIQQELVYKSTFIVWFFRNFISLLLVYYLWHTLFANRSEVFGYSYTMILTYVFGAFILKALVFSAKSSEVAGEIARGDLSNYLVKPVNYFKYWWTRDLSLKTLYGLLFAFALVILIIFFRPPFVFQTNPLLLFTFGASIVVSSVIFFLLLLIASFACFWFPEQAWGMQFLLFIFTELLGGAVFPLDVFPLTIQQLIYLTPFPYLIFKPLQILLGKTSMSSALIELFIALVWSFILYLIAKSLWQKGLKVYRSEGR